MAKKTSKKPVAVKSPVAKTKSGAARAVAAEKSVTPLAKISPASAPRTKSEIFSLLAETTGLSRKDVRAVFDSMSELVSKDMSGKGCGLFTVPGLMKIKRIKKPATPARKGINSFTGQEQTFKAKPARNIVKIRPMKALKDMV